MTAMRKFHSNGYDDALLCLIVSFVRYHEAVVRVAHLLVVEISPRLR